jgi:hypothetical protein
MSAPRTPTKKSSGLDDTLQYLNLRWDLNLPIRSGKESPSKSSIRGSAESKAASRITLLYWKNLHSLHQALRRFERHAQSIHAQWHFESHGEVDVVSPRAPMVYDSYGAYPLDQKLSAGQRHGLLEALSRFLNENEGRAGVYNDYDRHSESPVGRPLLLIISCVRDQDTLLVLQSGYLYTTCALSVSSKTSLTLLIHRSQRRYKFIETLDSYDH